MYITGTHIAYLHMCHRKLWLFAHAIRMEHRSELVAEGRLIEKSSYQQRSDRWTQIEMEGIKLDYFDPKQGILREVKKSKKRDHAHIAQVKYYLFVLERNEIPVKYGLLEYPRLRETEEVWLTDEDREEIPRWELDARKIIQQESCPKLMPKTLCKKCAYQEFCYAE
ncbi:MAG: CRISPR-associated protein Cas4 [Bacteroidota bacterium]